MLDDFFIRALLAGIGIALMAGPFGCLMVWRRLSFFGDTLAHAALLGIGIGIVLNIAPLWSVFIICGTLSIFLILAQRYSSLGLDSWLAIFSHGALAIGLVLMSVISTSSANFLSLLLGDILFVSTPDIWLIWGLAIVMVPIFIIIWPQLLRSTLNAELALAEGDKPEHSNLMFLLLLSLFVAVSIQIIGVLLITALLIIPAGAARQWSKNPEIMAVFASGLGVVSVCLGLWGSLSFDTASGPSIVVAALIVFIVLILARMIVRQLKSKQAHNKHANNN